MHKTSMNTTFARDVLEGVFLQIISVVNVISVAMRGEKKFLLFLVQPPVHSVFSVKWVNKAEGLTSIYGKRPVSPKFWCHQEGLQFFEPSIWCLYLQNNRYKKTKKMFIIIGHLRVSMWS